MRVLRYKIKFYLALRIRGDAISGAIFLKTYTRNHWKHSVKKGVLKNFTNFTGKYRFWRSLFNKVAGQYLFWRISADGCFGKFIWIKKTGLIESFYKYRHQHMRCNIPPKKFNKYQWENISENNERHLFHKNTHLCFFLSFKILCQKFFMLVCDLMQYRKG